MTYLHLLTKFTCWQNAGAVACALIENQDSLGGTALRTYEAIQLETQRTSLRVIATRAQEAKRKLSLYALDRILWALEDLNLQDRTTVPAPIVEQLLAFGVPYTSEVQIPDLIELVFTAQEQFMNVEPDEVNRVPTIEELEAYFEQSRVA